MADNRALMAAFQKVRADVDQALEQTRRKEEAARAAEEAKRAQERREKRQGSAAAKPSDKVSAGEANSARESKSQQSMVKAARVTPLQTSSSAAKPASAKVLKIRRSEPPVAIVQRVLSERCLPALLRRPALFFVSLLRCRGKAQGNAARCR